jgi:hypothetical protein
MIFLLRGAVEAKVTLDPHVKGKPDRLKNGDNPGL